MNEQVNTALLLLSMRLCFFDCPFAIDSCFYLSDSFKEPAHKSHSLVNRTTAKKTMQRCALFVVFVFCQFFLIVLFRDVQFRLKTHNNSGKTCLTPCSSRQRHRVMALCRRLQPQAIPGINMHVFYNASCMLSYSQPCIYQNSTTCPLRMGLF